MLVQTEEAYRELPGYCDNPNCFYCGESVSLPMIVWSGSNAFIQFHLGCAATFLLAFTRDLYEFKQSSHRSLEFDLSPEEKKRILGTLTFDDPHRDHIQQYNVQLTVDRFHFIDGGSEKAHIQEDGWWQTRCGHVFKEVRIIEARELDSNDVCRHCTDQGGVRIYPTGIWKEFDESSHEWKLIEAVI